MAIKQSKSSTVSDKASKPKSLNTERSKTDVNSLQAEVASFAASLGLASAELPTTNAGFNDADFRKTGTIKPQKPHKNVAENRSKQLGNTKPPKHNIKHAQENNRKGHGPFKGHGPPKGRVPPTLSEKEISGVPKSLPKLPLVKASSLSSPWHTDAMALEAKVLRAEAGGSAKPAVDLTREAWEALVQKKTQHAKQLMEQYISDYEEVKEKDGNMRMVSMAQKSGTTTDRVAAVTVLVQDNPLANMKALDTVLAMVTSKVGKRHAAVGIDALKELFLISLLPDRKLKYLGQQPLQALTESKDGNSLLLFWYWEDCLKRRFERFVAALENSSKDTLPFLKDKAVKTMFDLLKNKPEQERKLLSALVNKLGDPERKVASNAGYHLSCLLTAHPNMKAVVVEEVDMFIFRPNVGLRARYHAVLFLNQILLSSRGDGPKLAKRLVNIYFALFKVLMSNDNETEKDVKNPKGFKDKPKKVLEKKKKQESLNEAPVEVDSRLLSALLTGVNRAFPYVLTNEADDIIQKQTPVLFQMVHSKNFNIGVQALMLLYQLLAKNQTVSDRFYRALYSTLLTPALMRSSKTEMLLGLMFKALKTDINLKRVAAFSKRLLQVALQQPAQFACACLLLLSEVLKAKPVLWNAVLQPEDDDEDFEHFVDVREEGDVIAENDNNLNSEILESFEPVSPDNIAEDDDISNSGSEKEKTSDDSSDSGDDHSSENEGKLGSFMNNNMQSKVVKCPENKLHTNSQSDELHKKNAWPRPGYYDPRMREPAYCNADRACWWELAALAAHVHPSVAKMAQTLLFGANIVYNGDPLNDLSLGAFIDKFIEKKPKASKKSDGDWHGGSQIAPARKVDIVPPLVGPDILSLAEEEVPPEDVVFHKFYTVKTTSSKRKAKKKKDKLPDSEVTGDDLFVEADVDDEFAGGDESDNEEIDDLIDQERELDAQSQSDGDYDYEKLDDVLEQEEDALLAEDSEGDTNIVEDISEGNETPVDEDLDSDLEVIKFADKPKGKKRKASRKPGQSPFASLDDYKHLLEAGENANDDCGTKRTQKSRKKLRGHLDR